ncbi:MAG: cytochrome c, class I [Gammaproteobacteria bacterium SG8_11]|nr:MAG: cytochrome c, class I [Gammaproteobacteria bacterium SG8_11]
MKMRTLKLMISSLALLSLLLTTTAVMSADEKAEPAAKPAPKSKVSAANVFNRLLKKEKVKNAPPAQDGIHDPANDNTHVLQPPMIAYEGLPTTEFGNYVDWVKALNDGLLNPRYDRFDPTVEPLVMDLDIVREVKASVPDVVFPHKPHTQWLHCSNCHPKIFIPQRNANVINMSAILLGQKCGVCHGKVSFPITTKSCKMCHSKPKPDDWKPPKSEATLQNPWR